MPQDASISSAFALDAQALTQLRQQAKADPGKAAGAVATQFEVLFLNMVLKSMRAATPEDSPFDSEQSRLYTSMLDQQLAQHMAKRGIGLADVLKRQLSKNTPDAVAPAPAAADAADRLALQAPLMQPLPAMQEPLRFPDAYRAERLPRMPALSVALPGVRVATDPAAQPLPAAAATAQVSSDAVRAATAQAAMPGRVTASAPVAMAAGRNAAGAVAAGSQPLALASTRAFVERIWQHATDAARAIGIQPHFMVGQAALESGWGAREIRAADGTPTHNLFAVKAGAQWKGPVVEKVTTEYVHGVPQKTLEKFRAYANYEEGFRDYAQLLSTNPRYAAARVPGNDALSFARGLQKAGYATDPAYADKLVRIINGETMRSSLRTEPTAQVVART